MAGQYSLVLLMLFFTLISTAHSNQNGVSSAFGHSKQSEENQASESAIKAILRELEDCPAWSRALKENVDIREKILQCMERISQHDLTDIREGLAQYTSQNNIHRTDYLARMGTTLILNRYLFNVPPVPKAPYRSFGGWVPSPEDKDQLNYLWPLSIDKDGKLALTGTLGAYLGGSHQAIAEFDYFNGTFGLRKPASKK